MIVENLRISKLRDYLVNIINHITKDTNYQINADMLSIDINDYSLDKIPTSSVVERWITGDEIHKDVYSFRSRRAYSQDLINNLENIGFFEQFENIIKNNDKDGILPDIENIESIQCLNCATLITTDGKQAEFSIQIQITYREAKQDIISL